MRNKRYFWNYIIKYNINSVRVKICITVLLLILMPIGLIILFSYRSFDNEVKMHMTYANEELLENNALVIDNVITELKKVIDVISEKEEITEMIKVQDKDADYWKKLKRTSDLFAEFILSNTYIKGIYLWSEGIKTVIIQNKTRTVCNDEWKEKWYWIGRNISLDAPYLLTEQEGKVFLCKNISLEGCEKAGMLVLELENDKIWKMAQGKNAGQDQFFFVLDHSDNVIYCNKQEFYSWEKTVRQNYIDSMIKSVKKYCVFVDGDGEKIASMRESEHNGWLYVMLTDIAFYTEENNKIRIFLYSSIISGVITCLIAVFIITFVACKPIKDILNVMEKTSASLDDECPKYHNEVLYITRNILDEKAEREQLERDLQARLTELKKEQYRALQLQIDPHFLYNTLETIKWHSVELLGFGNDLSQMLSSMARYYRAILGSEDVIIILKNEIEFTKLYIDVIKIRFGNKINIQFDIDENLLQCKVVKMCIQPLVENAINHGMAAKGYHGNIIIRAYREEQHFFIAVENDGKKVSEDIICDINMGLKLGIKNGNKRVGLQNINTRVKLVFGVEYGVFLSCIHEQNGTDAISDITVSTIKLPYNM